MADARDEASGFKRPGWLESSIWMGANLRGLLRVLAQGRFRVAPRYWFDCGADLAAAGINSGLGVVQLLTHGRALARYPDVEDPVIILGHWRTGTTWLHELLTRDPRHCGPTTFQCFLPNHMLLTERWLAGWTGFTLPNQRPQDKMSMGWQRPQEEEFALLNLGLPTPYATIAFPNQPLQFADYVDLESLPAADRRRWQAGLMRFVKGVAYRQDGARVVLKSPYHSFRLPVLTEMFPQARFIHLVRNPLEVFPSTVRLWRTLYGSQGYQVPRDELIEPFVFDMFTRLHERFEATRDAVLEGRLCEVRYERLKADPMAELERIYTTLELGDFAATRPEIESHLEEQREYRPHEYQLPDQLAARIYERWKSYFEQYDYPPPLERK